MIDDPNSVESLLTSIIDKLEFEENKCHVKREPCKNHVISKKNRLVSHDSTDVREILCRICYDLTPHLPVVYPCKCKGTMGAVHLACLERWLEESNRNDCELCGHEFQIERTPRYGIIQSITIWLCSNPQQHQLYMRNIRSDLYRCIIFTPLTAVLSYTCIVAADFYAAGNYDSFPPTRWTIYSLLVTMLLLIFSYFIWLYMTIKYHQKLWFCWWQKNSIVRVIVSSAGINFNEP